MKFDIIGLTVFNTARHCNLVKYTFTTCLGVEYWWQLSTYL